MNYLLGIDAGTTSFKAVLFDENGEEIVRTQRNYNLIIPYSKAAEFEVERYWDIFIEITKEIFRKSKIKSDKIKALSIDSQGETLICLDAEGKPVCNSIVWIDKRAKKEAQKIKDTFDEEQTYEITGQPEINETWTASKILWLKENKPHIYNNTHKFLLLEDYLIFRLTKEYVTDSTLLPSTLLYDVKKGKWWVDMLQYLGLSSKSLPSILKSGEVIKKVIPEASAQTGLSTETYVVTGAMDQIANMIGAGNIKQNIVSETTGTCLSVCRTVDEFKTFEQKNNIACHPHGIAGKYCLLMFSDTAGMVLEWFKNNFYSCESKKVDDIFKLIDCEIEKIEVGSEGLIMLPELADAAGVISGISIEHTKAHFARAILESVAYILKNKIDKIDISKDIKEIRSLGGGAKSCIWNKIKADVTNKKIITVRQQESACLGAAILAGVGIGMFSSVEEACKKMVRIENSYIPDDKNKYNYRKSYNDYLSLKRKMKREY